MFFLINRTEFVFKPFHDEIIEKLQNIADCKNKKKNLLINIPVGSGKSLIVEMFITWTFARNPQIKHLYVSHSEVLITKLSRETLEIIESQYWQDLFKHRLDQKSSTQYNFIDAGNRSGMTAAPIGSAITGIDAGNPAVNGFNGTLTIDDPLDAGNADSDILLNECIQNYTSKLKTRLRTVTTPIILIMQRLSINDLAQYIIDAEKEDWDIITIKAYDEENNTSFWPEKFPVKMLTDIKYRTPVLYYTQYQQEPRARGGNLFTRDMFLVDALPEHFDFTAILADTAYRGNQNNDFTVFIHIGKSNDRLFIINLLKKKINSDLIVSFFLPLIESAMLSEDFIGCYIEPKGHGIYLNQYLPQIGVSIPAEHIVRDFFKDRKRDKVIRANVVLPKIAQNKITFSNQMDQHLVEEIIQECLQFPNAKHDDCVDVLVDSSKLAYMHVPSLLDVI